ncbi:hypothetical protein ACIQHV_11435 [Bacillus bombysepticus]|uniref:Uncharacterized protein n=1 Tax=Bacillus thuringiensis serovar kumamotoensis TaxID=132267 RepID=A0A9X6JHB4_BACUK|nr:hypothetical protein [Bacillus thuringiensis]MEC2869497.1 hypothetical protein [Bacillus cereus]OTZ65587.1 hypothetical protein BK769_33300 [Bacillus thuringiensis serovar kumamtoensis]
MRTNVKNGTIFLGYAATVGDKIRIGNKRLMNIEYFTLADFCPVLAETNEKGVVKRLYVDVNCEADEIFNNAIRHIKPNDVLTGTIIDPKDFFAERTGGKE